MDHNYKHLQLKKYKHSQPKYKHVQLKYKHMQLKKTNTCNLKKQTHATEPLSSQHSQKLIKIGITFNEIRKIGISRQNVVNPGKSLRNEFENDKSRIELFLLFECDQ